MAVIAGAIITGVATLGGAGLHLAGKGKEAKAQKDAMKAEIIRSISEQKRAEMEAKSKEKRLMTIIVVSVLLLLIMTMVFFYIKQKSKTAGA